jgi:hypothetical protein
MLTWTTEGFKLKNWNNTSWLFSNGILITGKEEDIQHKACALKILNQVYFT